MRRTAVLLFVAALAGAAVSGCARPVGSVDDVGVPYPQGCAAHGIPMRRCDLVIERMAREHGIDLATVSEILLLGDPGCGQAVSPGTLCKRSGGVGPRVRFVLPGGPPVEETVYCGVGATYDPECTDTPQIRISSPTLGGYHDVPEGATPVPTIDPAVRRGAQPLTVAGLDIPIDHVGAYRVDVGTATLPNGILSVADLALANDTPTDLLVDGDGVSMQLLLVDGGAPLLNIYETGWHAGVVKVRAIVTFTVIAFDPGAVLAIRNVVVG